jgi:hypothetical protein
MVGFNTNHASNTCEEYYLLGCSLIEVHQQFGEIYYLHLQGEIVSQANSKQELLLSAYMSEDSSLHSHRHENLRSHVLIDVFDVHHVCHISDKYLLTIIKSACFLKVYHCI